MNDNVNSRGCERSSDLMAFLYDELAASETREFESHLQQCNECRQEAASFGVVRQSIRTWRDEVLTGFVPPAATPARRSAVAAFRQFFDFSPLWLKGATAFAVLTFCVLAGLWYVNLKKENPVAAGTDTIYTQQDVNRLVDEALARQAQERTQVEQAQVEQTTVTTLKPAALPRKPPRTQAARSRRPLSRAEREQLAADLRLLPTDEDLDLPGDRINH